jgi:hypothetical protein
MYAFLISSMHATCPARFHVTWCDHPNSTCRFMRLPESGLLFDWRFTANQFILAPCPLRPTTIIFFQLNTCAYSPYVTSSLTRGWVCRLKLLLALASAVIGSESWEFYCLRRETPLTWRAWPPYLYPPGTGWPGYTPRHWVPFLSPPTTCRATVEVFDPASTRSLNFCCVSEPKFIARF